LISITLNEGRCRVCSHILTTSLHLLDSFRTIARSDDQSLGGLGSVQHGSGAVHFKLFSLFSAFGADLLGLCSWSSVLSNIYGRRL
jgi:hypothetical protein